jgi:TonB family protein
MLQPLQLTDVSIRYAEEIVELRDFLIKAGCTVRTGQALGQIAARLPRDRAFHRDLTSNVWVVIDRCDRISYSDLLGVLAIAAAGSSFAATADEDDAHCLLRFLMEARHSLNTLSDNRNRIPARGAADAMANPSIGPLQPVRGNGREVSIEPLPLVERDVFSLEDSQNSDSRRKGLPWVVAAGCVFVVVLTGFWLKHRPAESADIEPASVTSRAAANVASTPVTKESVTPSSLPPDERVARAVVHPSIPRRNSRAMPLNLAGRSSRRTLVTAPFIPSPAPNAPPPVTAATVTHGPVAAEALPAPVSTPRPPDYLSALPPAIRAAGTASPAPVGPPAVVSSGSSGPSSNPQDSAQPSGDNISRTSTAPTLLRRRPPASSSASSEDGTDLASEGSPSAASASGTTRGGTVRVTSLGAMASNLLYSPVPAYPAAASASHVQGEVKLSADVDRNGNVASVRVISGPPLLRDAALDAVQRWRYRPYISSGGPIPMAAISIMDFQLP